MFTPFNDIDLDGLAKQNVSLVHPTQEDLPKSSQGYAANNAYPGFPPLMSDGRSLIASWQPEAVTNNLLLTSNGIKSNWEYRKYLTHNANAIMHRDFVEAANDCGYYDLGMDRSSNVPVMPIFAGISKKFASPAFYTSFAQPEASFGNFESDLKADYLSREQLAARTVTPVITQADLLQWKSR